MLLGLATVLKLVPPAATKFVIDHVLSDQPISERLLAVRADSSAIGGSGCILVVAVVFVVSVLGTLARVYGAGGWRRG